MARDRLASIQRLRGVAALSVVLVHAIDLVDPLTDPARRAIVERFWLIDDLGASGVDLFFVLSGFVMALGIDRFAGADGWRRFLRARAERIAPLFWLLCALFAVRLAAGGATIGWASIVNAVTVLPVVGGRDHPPPPLYVGWTLGFEVAFYLIVAAATRIGRPAMWLLPATLAAGAAGLVLHPDSAVAATILNPIMFEFGAGIAVHALWRRGVPAPLAAVAMPVGLLLLVGLRLVRPDWIFSPQAGLVMDGSSGLVRSALWGLPWALVVLGAVCGEGRGRRDPLVAIGDASYALYLGHAMLAAEAARQGWAAAFADPRAAVAAFVAASLGVGIALHRFVEVPLARRLARAQATSSARSARMVRPSVVTSANPPSTRIRAVTVVIDE